MTQIEALDVNVDVVLCIDATGSMSPVLDMVKDSATSFYDTLIEALAEKNRAIENLRVKVIAYRDFTCDGDDSIEESNFFNLPEQNDEFKKFVRKISARGGGDAPETTLDAISIAMKSDWVKQGTKKRHIIMVWTDAPTKKPTGGCGIVDGIPNSMEKFVEWWMDPQTAIMDQSAKRLVIFAPKSDTWDVVTENFDLCYFSETELGSGMTGCDLEMVMATLSNTV